MGLTATHKDEVDQNTYSLCELENGVPTNAHSLEEAVRDGFLVPPRAVSVPLKFQREGIRYDELSEQDKDQWDALEDVHAYGCCRWPMPRWACFVALHLRSMPSVRDWLTPGA